MSADSRYNGGENFDLRKILLRGRNLRLNEKVKFFESFLGDLASNREMTCMRCVTSAAGREVTVHESVTGSNKKMLMFGSNNYLGLANHPYVKMHVEQAVREFGAGIGGPPLLNGYTALHSELEERLAALKGCEDALIFSSGYGANVGLVAGLMNRGDIVLYDEYSHASFYDGIKMSGVESHHFPHNDMGRLKKLLERHTARKEGDVFVGVEGVYSMDGDLAPLDELVKLCKTYGATLILDDAHGTGVIGPSGRGTAEKFGVEGSVDITVGTFSKAFAVTGGFVASSKTIVNYLRFFARPYMFSASLPPPIIAAVLAGLDVIENEPELLTALWENIEYASHGLRSLGFDVSPQSAIIPLRVPPGMNIRKAAFMFHELGIFMNSIEYPAVPVAQQRFRISLMASHQKGDIDRLIEAVGSVWKHFEDRMTTPQRELCVEAA